MDDYRIDRCPYCGGIHTGICRRVRAIEYDEDGKICRIEFHEWQYLAPKDRISLANPSS